MNTNLMCATCATEFAGDEPRDGVAGGVGAILPEVCPICNDDRQYIPREGQRWTSFAEVVAGHGVAIRVVSAADLTKGAADRRDSVARMELYALQVAPAFAIDQRALLLCTPGGNILWDCIPLIDGPTIEFIRSRGGLKAIAISHPHYYSVMRRWAETFDCPIYIHELERPWVFNGGGHVEFWQGEGMELFDGIRVVRIGGHFPGSSVLHVAGPAAGTRGSVSAGPRGGVSTGPRGGGLSAGGVLLTGDTLYLSRSMRHISMMYSYPNHIPLPTAELRAAVGKVLAMEFDTLYGAFAWQDLEGCAREVFLESTRRYDCL